MPDQRLLDIFPNDISVWKHGDFPIPEWVHQFIAGDIEPNGTFLVGTDFGQTRVHLGNVVIKQKEKIWVQPSEDVNIFIRNLRMSGENIITNIGPGKVRQYGVNKLEKHSGQTNRKNRPFPIRGAPPTIEWIAVELLSVDTSYQRSTENTSSRRLITSIATNFDWRLCMPLVVSRRLDDTSVIIDGQHRWMAARQRADIPHLPCCVFRYSSMSEEARMFIVANRARKSMSRLDDFYAALAAGDEDAKEIQQIVCDAGLRIARSTSATSWKPGEIAFTSAIAEAIRRYGPAITSGVLTNMAVAFPNQRFSHGGAMFVALTKIMARPFEGFDPDRLVSALETKTQDQWGSYAVGFNGGDARANAFHAAIMSAYQTIECEV